MYISLSLCGSIYVYSFSCISLYLYSILVKYAYTYTHTHTNTHTHTHTHIYIYVCVCVCVCVCVNLLTISCFVIFFHIRIWHPSDVSYNWHVDLTWILTTISAKKYAIQTSGATFTITITYSWNVFQYVFCIDYIWFVHQFLIDYIIFAIGFLYFCYTAKNIALVDPNIKCSSIIRFVLVSFLNGVSTFMNYLMLKPSF